MKTNENWLSGIVSDLREQQKEPKQLCWTLSELHKKDRIPTHNKEELISKIQSLLSREGVRAEKIEAKFTQHNSYLDIPLRNGKHIRIMDKKPYGDPVSSNLILKPEKDLGTVESGGHELRVGIYPATLPLTYALSSDKISVKDAKEQIEALREDLKKRDLVLWDPWPQNFGVNNSGKIFISFDGAVARSRDIANKPFEPYSAVTIENLQGSAFNNLDKMLTEAATSKKAEEILSGRTSQNPKSI